MGLMLEALKRIEDRTPTPVASTATRAVEPKVAAKPLDANACPSWPGDTLPSEAFDAFCDTSRWDASALPRPETSRKEPTDPRYAALADRLLSDLPSGQRGALLLAGVGDCDVGQLRPLFPLLAQQIDGGVLVVDAGEGCRAFARCLSDEKKIRQQVLPSGSTSWRDAVSPSAYSGLDLLLSAESTNDNAEFHEFNTRELIEQLRRAYSLVLLVGSPPSPDEMTRLAALCDGIYLVLRLGETSRAAAERALAPLRTTNARVLGCVLLDGPSPPASAARRE